MWSFSAQPSTDYSGQSVTHRVELPDDDSSVSTELQCDIQPGALRQSYSVQWIQVFNTSHIIITEGMFSLTLTVNSSTSGSLYRCCVTIIHNDANGLSSIYKGRLIGVFTTEGNDQLTTLSFTVILFCSILHTEIQLESNSAGGVVTFIIAFSIGFLSFLCLGCILVCGATCIIYSPCKEAWYVFCCYHNFKYIIAIS